MQKTITTTQFVTNPRNGRKIKVGSRLFNQMVYDGTLYGDLNISNLDLENDIPPPTPINSSRFSRKPKKKKNKNKRTKMKKNKQSIDARFPRPKAKSDETPFPEMPDRTKKDWVFLFTKALKVVLEDDGIISAVRDMSQEETEAFVDSILDI